MLEFTQYHTVFSTELFQLYSHFACKQFSGKYVGTFIISGKNVEHRGRLESSSIEVPENCIAEDEWLDLGSAFCMCS